MAVFVVTLFVTCLNVFLMTGSAAMADLSAKQKADMQVIPAPPIDAFKIKSLSRSIKHEAGDMEMLAKDVVGRLNQINKAMDLHTSAFILKQMQQEAHGFQDSLKTIIRELAANSTKNPKLNDVPQKIRTELMFEAFNRGNEAIASFWIAAGVDIKARHPIEKKSILRLAVTRQWPTVIQQLMEQGVKVDEVEVNKETQLLQHIRDGASAEFIQTLIVDLKADADAVDGSAMGETALHLAARLNRPDIVQLLLKYQGSKGLEAQDERGYRPLHSAAVNNSSAVIGLLIGNGALLESRTLSGKTPLHLAVIENHKDAVQNLVMFGANLLAKDDQGKTPIDYAVMHKDIERILNNYTIFRQYKNAN